MYNDIIEFLDNKRLKEALVQLTALAHEADNWQLSSEIESLQTTYSYMLQYAAQGMEDPNATNYTISYSVQHTNLPTAPKPHVNIVLEQDICMENITVFSKFHHILIRKSVSVLKLSAKIWEWLR